MANLYCETCSQHIDLDIDVDHEAECLESYADMVECREIDEQQQEER